jgi:hypothetical protein
MNAIFKSKQKESINIIREQCLSPSLQDLASKTTNGKFIKQCNVGLEYLSGRINAVNDLREMRIGGNYHSRTNSGLHEASLTMNGVQ